MHYPLTVMKIRPFQFGSVSEAHLHFEIRTKAAPHSRLQDRIDPVAVLGYSTYSCSA